MGKRQLFSMPAGLGLALAAWLGPLTAHAVVRIETREYGAWNDTVAALQREMSAQGRAVHVTVRDEDLALRCDEYRLALDEEGLRAFHLGACDPATGDTELVLASRAALFAHDDVVPRPLRLRLEAEVTRHAQAWGGATMPAGAELLCSVAVRPFLQDLEHNTRVYLEPGRFALRPVDAGLTVETSPLGAWLLRSAVRASLSVRYEVVDTARNTTVLRETATLTCGTEPATTERPFPLSLLDAERTTVAPPAPAPPEPESHAGLVEVQLHSDDNAEFSLDDGERCTGACTRWVRPGVIPLRGYYRMGRRAPANLFVTQMLTVGTVPLDVRVADLSSSRSGGLFLTLYGGIFTAFSIPGAALLIASTRPGVSTDQAATERVLAPTFLTLGGAGIGMLSAGLTLLTRGPVRDVRPLAAPRFVGASVSPDGAGGVGAQARFVF